MMQLIPIRASSPQLRREPGGDLPDSLQVPDRVRVGIGDSAGDLIELGQLLDRQVVGSVRPDPVKDQPPVEGVGDSLDDLRG